MKRKISTKRVKKLKMITIDPVLEKNVIKHLKKTTKKVNFSGFVQSLIINHLLNVKR